MKILHTINLLTEPWALLIYIYYNFFHLLKFGMALHGGSGSTAGGIVETGGIGGIGEIVLIGGIGGIRGIRRIGEIGGSGGIGGAGGTRGIEWSGRIWGIGRIGGSGGIGGAGGTRGIWGAGGIGRIEGSGGMGGAPVKCMRSYCVHNSRVRTCYYICTGCPNKHGNSVTNSISSF